MSRALENPEQILAKDAMIQGNTTKLENPADHQITVLRQQLRQLIKEKASL